jgi:hypothetical protein
MPIRPSKYSRQHELLLELEKSGEEVYYAAPGFYKSKELDDAYQNKQIRSKSIWIKPADIDKINDDKKHYVAFQLSPKKYFFVLSQKV